MLPPNINEICLNNEKVDVFEEKILDQKPQQKGKKRISSVRRIVSVPSLKLIFSKLNAKEKKLFKIRIGCFILAFPCNIAGIACGALLGSEFLFITFAICFAGCILTVIGISIYLSLKCDAERMQYVIHDERDDNL